MSMRAEASILPLSFRDITFARGGETLLGPLSLDVTARETLALIGPNGAGKSLLLRLAHGLISPSSGVISWSLGDGMLAGRRRHAMVFQKPVMLRRSAMANLIHACRASGFGMAEARGRAVKVMERFGLATLAARPARLLSGGEQQRLAIARAAAIEPEVLFLDEPTSQLDPGATRQIEEMLQALAAQGVTIILATHDLGQARRLASRVVFLHRGRIAEDAAAVRFFAGPESPEARAFIAGDLLW